MATIKTWQERKGYGPNTKVGIGDVDDEIAELRAALAAAPAQGALTDALPELPRYDLVESQYGSGYMVHWDKALELDPEGEWCKFADAVAIIEQRIKGQVSDMSLRSNAADAARLEFMMEREAWIAWSKDGESCRLFHRSADGEPMPMLGWGARHWSHDPREAIDAAIAAIQAQAGDAQGEAA